MRASSPGPSAAKNIGAKSQMIAMPPSREIAPAMSRGPNVVEVAGAMAA
jgi:hypothetical protein